MICSAMQVLFLSQPFEPKRVDSMFEGERDAALSAGFSVSLIDADALEAGDFAAATRKVSKPESPSPALYRGWMLDVQTYASLYEALSRQGLLLINTPEQYQHTHHLPDSYEVIRSHTPLTVWTTTGSQYDEEAIRQLLAPFGDAPIIVKDFVKSQKHYWEEACFIPAASDAAAVARVVKRFVELQGERLTGGLVFRAFVELEPLTIHARSGMPLTKEFRLFVLDGVPIASAQYWEEGDYAQERPPVEHFASVAAHVRSRFFTMDVARRTDGTWIVMELGDGQVSGVPERLPAEQFYRALARAMGRA